MSTLTLRVPNPNIERIAEDPEPDLLRVSQGIRVECHYTPTLKHPERAVITVYAGKVLLDQADVPAAEGFERWKHTSVWSKRYADAVA
jgi:hypothetical protein